MDNDKFRYSERNVNTVSKFGCDDYWSGACVQAAESVVYSWPSPINLAWNIGHVCTLQ